MRGPGARNLVGRVSDRLPAGSDTTMGCAASLHLGGNLDLYFSCLFFFSCGPWSVYLSGERFWTFGRNFGQVFSSGDERPVYGI